jgi:hypothetical protein
LTRYHVPRRGHVGQQVPFLEPAVKTPTGPPIHGREPIPARPRHRHRCEDRREATLAFFVSTTSHRSRGVELILRRTPDNREVASVATGEETIAYCQRERCDVVLTDLRLRTMSGLEAPAGATTVTAGSFATPATDSEHPASILRVVKT